MRKDSKMNASRHFVRALQFLIPGIFLLLATPARSQAQFLVVDCSGTNPYAYSSINAALPNAGPGAFILVSGTCNESVALGSRSNLNLGAFYGQTATINGNPTVASTNTSPNFPPSAGGTNLPHEIASL